MLGLITKAHNRITDLKSFGKDEQGATAIEYGLIARRHRRRHHCRGVRPG